MGSIIRCLHLGLTLVVLALPACQFDTAGVEPVDAQGLDGPPLVDASPDAGTDGGGSCDTGEQRCHGITVQLCVDGVWTDGSVCDWGCSVSPEGHPYCGTPNWAESVDPSTDVGTGEWLAAQGSTTINTDSGIITTPNGPLTLDYQVRTHYRSGGLEPVTIIGFTEVTIPVGARVEVVGTRALALVSYGSIVVGGELIAVGYDDGTPGPGGFAGGIEGQPGPGDGGGAPGENSGTAVLKSGAGGGGHTAVGGDGGTVDQLLGTVVGGAGGDAVIVDPVSGPLVGGYGGGATPGELLGGNAAPGGGGGGALLLAAQVAVEILTTGVVNAGGGGGASRGAGGGGGAGGMVIVQSHACIIEGVLAANGGGGGAVENGDSGATGSAGDQPTPGGGTRGGAGGAGSSLEGEPGTGNDYNGGGGGGAAGFVRLDTVLPPDIANGTVSPHEGTLGHAQNAFPLL